MAEAFYITGKDDDMRKAANIMLWTGIAIAACIMTWLLFQAWQEESSIQAAIEQDKSLAEEAVALTELPAEEAETEDDENMLRSVDWEMLEEMNSDVAGWLYIPGTCIDYPVLQEQEGAKGFYLDHDFRGDELASGAVFLPVRPYPDVEDAHTLLFGHRMKDRSLSFGMLGSYYGDEESGKGYEYAYLYWLGRTEKWRLWCMVDGNKKDAVYKAPYVLGDEAYGEMLAGIDRKKAYGFGDAPDKDDRTLVLSTCSGNAGGRQRLYVVFVLDRVGEAR